MIHTLYISARKKQRLIDAFNADCGIRPGPLGSIPEI
jgi:hypothetical protein